MNRKAAIVSLIQAGISSGLPGIGNSECSDDPWSNNDEMFARKKDQLKTHFYLKTALASENAESLWTSRGSRGKHGIVSSSPIPSKTVELMCNSYTRYRSSVNWL